MRKLLAALAIAPLLLGPLVWATTASAGTIVPGPATASCWVYASGTGANPTGSTQFPSGDTWGLTCNNLPGNEQGSLLINTGSAWLRFNFQAITAGTNNSNCASTTFPSGASNNGPITLPASAPTTYGYVPTFPDTIPFTSATSPCTTGTGVWQDNVTLSPKMYIQTLGYYPYSSASSIGTCGQINTLSAYAGLISWENYSGGTLTNYCSNISANTYTFWNFTQVGPGFGGTAAPGCTLQDVTGDTGDLGTTYTSTMATNNVAFPLTFQYTTPADTLVLVDPTVSSGTTQTIWGKSFYTSGMVTVDGNNPLQGDLNPPTSVSYAPASGDVFDPQVWCHTGGSSGGWINWGTLIALVGGGSPVAVTVTSPGNGPFDFASCFNQATANISLWDPLSWISAAIQIGACVMEWLFVPNSWSTILPSNLSTTPPFQWVSDAVSAAGTLEAGVTSGLATNNCSAPSFSPFSSFTTGILHSNSTIHNFTITLPSPADAGCPSTYANTTAGELFGYRIFFRDLELFGLLVAFLATIWRLLPWSHDSDARVIERWGGLNNDGDYIDTYWTNEGSDV